jgi:hypothetical protein
VLEKHDHNNCKQNNRTAFHGHPFLDISGGSHRAIQYWPAHFPRCSLKDEKMTLVASMMIRRPIDRCPPGHSPGRASRRLAQAP